MEALSNHHLTVFFLSLGTLLASAHVLGEVARRFRQPAVLGEILAGILLGPTVLGAVAPAANAFLFPTEGPVATGLQNLATLAIALFLLVAGMDVDLSTVWRLGRSALSVSAGGILLPYALGFATAWFFPGMVGAEPGADPVIFSLFFATALSISALPVIAKILYDLKLFRTDFGMIVVAAAIVNDLAGWISFAVILGLMRPNAQPGLAIGATIWLTLGFTAFILTIGRWLLDRLLPWVQAHTTWPGGVLGFAVTGALLCAAFTEWIGVHAVFGAFLFGVALGDSRHLQERTRATIDQFVSFVFAPLFFATVGLRVNFIQQFDLTVVVAVLAIASAGKVVGCGLGARWSGLPAREAMAVGCAMNARGVMEIILSLLALQAGIIGEPLFVALVIMALATSMTSGAFIQKLLRRKTPHDFTDFLAAKTFCANLSARSRREAILQLCETVGEGAGAGAGAIAEAVWKREQIGPTGIGQGLAIPHARIEGLKRPVLALGVYPDGVDFDAPDGQPARLVFLFLTPKQDNETQLEVLASIGRAFHDPDMVERALRANNYTEFLALAKSGAPHSQAPSA